MNYQLELLFAIFTVDFITLLIVFLLNKLCEKGVIWMTKFEITGTFKVIYEDSDEENAVMQCMENYLGAIMDDCDDCFQFVKFELSDVKELSEWLKIY